MENAQRLFLGLAHAQPTERNDDDEVRGAVGAYFNAVALADDEETFAERVRIELEEMDFELVDIDNVRLFSQALEDGFLAPSLLELANAAAHENTTRFDTFNLYMEKLRDGRRGARRGAKPARRPRAWIASRRAHRNSPNGGAGGGYGGLRRRDR